MARVLYYVCKAQGKQQMNQNNLSSIGLCLLPKLNLEVLPFDYKLRLRS